MSNALFPVSSIHVNGRKRQTDLDKVESLAQSIQQLGLLNPLTVTPDGRLVTGLHRLEAVQQLGWQEVPVNVVTLDSLLLELAEIDENLIRNNLTELQESLQIARRKEIYQALHPQTKNGANGRRGSGNGVTISRNDIMTFSEDTANKASKSRRVIERKAMIGEALQKVGYRLEGTPIATSQKGLIALAQMNEQEREEVIEKLETFEALTIREAQRLIHQEEQSTMPEDLPNSLIERCQFYAGELEEVEHLIEDESVDAIITHLPRLPGLYELFAVFSSRVLRPGGLLFCAVDHAFLPAAIKELSARLSYHWTIALLRNISHPMAAAPEKVYSAWKPVLWFVKDRNKGDWVDDTAYDMSDLIERFTLPGQTIFDPFMRSGLIVVPAAKMNRKVVGIGTLDALEAVLKRLAAIQEEE